MALLEIQEEDLPDLTAEAVVPHLPQGIAEDPTAEADTTAEAILREAIVALQLTTKDTESLLKKECLTLIQVKETKEGLDVYIPKFYMYFYFQQSIMMN